MNGKPQKTGNDDISSDKDKLLKEISELEEQNQLLKAEITQLESFQLECDREATHLRNLAELSRDMGIYRLRADIDNPERGRVLYMSPAAKRILGVPNPMDHNSWFAYCHPDDQKLGLERQMEALRTGVFRLDARLFQNEDGSWRWVRMYAFATPNEKNEKDVFNGFVWDVTAEKRARQEAEQKSKRLRRLSYQLFQEEERQRKNIAGVLHDKIGQSLSLLRFSLAREAKTETQGSALHQCLTILDQIIAETRTLTTELYPNILRQAGLVEALRWLCSMGHEVMGIDIQFDTNSEHKDLDNDIAIFLYRTASELLTNCMKHSGAARVSLSLFEGREGLCMKMSDNGRGFVYNDEKANPGGFGLFSIREKLIYLEGRLDIETAPGAGTEITVSVPY